MTWLARPILPAARCILGDERRNSVAKSNERVMSGSGERLPVGHIASKTSWTTPVSSIVVRIHLQETQWCAVVIRPSGGGGPSVQDAECRHHRVCGVDPYRGKVRRITSGLDDVGRLGPADSGREPRRGPGGRV
jgi:hypothetical protein